MTTARQLIDALGLAPHPEGGRYRETWRAPAAEGARAAGTAIYYLLEAGEFSHWHRVDAAEIWHFYAGAPLSLTLSPNGHDAEAHRLGPEILAGQRPQIVVPAGWWQCATSLGAWTLVGCTVSPGFEFAGFELAPPDWRPTPRPPGGG
jgi:predicted cupin superfamily sugar epimerase